MSRKLVITIGIAAAALAVLLAVLNLKHGNLNQDEGWYLYAAKMVRSGHAPYADFAFTQGPVLPHVYALFHPVVESLGVVGGRLITTLFGLLAALFVAAAAWRASGKNRNAACVATFLLVACNVYQGYFTTIVKTYALCNAFLMAGFFLLSLKHKVAVLFAGVLLALAAGTRLSAGIVLPVTGIWLLFQKDRKLEWIWFGIGGGFALLAIFLPSIITAPEQIRFGLLDYHAGRDPGGFGKLLTLKAGFACRFVQAYLIFTLLTLSAICFRGKQRTQTPFTLLMWLCGIGITLVHASAAFPYDDYQTIAYPILAVAVILTLLPQIGEKWVVPGLSFLLLASVAAAFSSPINQDWFVRGRDRIWWQFKEKSDLQTLRDAADYIRQNSPENSLLLTQDTYLAIEANRSVPADMELGPFCYYPDMPREQAEKLHLLNREMLSNVLAQSDAPLAAFSGYGLAIESPAIVPVSEGDSAKFSELVRTRYERVVEIPHFGQAHTTLNIFMLKDSQ